MGKTAPAFSVGVSRNHRSTVPTSVVRIALEFVFPTVLLGAMREKVFRWTGTMKNVGRILRWPLLSWWYVKGRVLTHISFRCSNNSSIFIAAMIYFSISCFSTFFQSLTHLNELKAWGAKQTRYRRFTLLFFFFYILLLVINFTYQDLRGEMAWQVDAAVSRSVFFSWSS